MGSTSAVLGGPRLPHRCLQVTVLTCLCTCMCSVIVTLLLNTYILLIPLCSAAFTPANPHDTLFMFRQPRDRESQTIGVGQPLDNRTALTLGANTETSNTVNGNRLLRCVAAHADDAGQPLGTLDWILNGRGLSTGDNGGRIMIRILDFGARYGADLIITDFDKSDAGIYQCVANDAPTSDSDIFLSIPFRLDTGTIVCMQYIA